MPGPFGRTPEVVAAIERYDTWLRKALPDVQVIVDEPGGVIGYGYGAGYKRTVCTLIPSKKGLKLGFYRGAELHDPNGLLQGTGKVHRYVDLDLHAAPSPAVLTLLHAALRAYKMRVGA